jgi:biotin carboxyl carrier protein
MEAEVVQLVATQRRSVDELQQALAPRRAAEAAELKALEDGLAAAQARQQSLPAETRAAKQATAAAEAERQQLQKGLSQARRTWVRLFEPMVGALLLFFCIVNVGLAMSERDQVLKLEGGGLLVGALVGWAVGRRRVRA